jgi:hypothetical protein
MTAKALLVFFPDMRPDCAGCAGIRNPDRCQGERDAPTSATSALILTRRHAIAAGDREIAQGPASPLADLSRHLAFEPGFSEIYLGAVTNER